MRLYETATGEEVSRGDVITSHSGQTYKFLSIIPGRISAKIYCEDTQKGIRRELFDTVFPAYEVRAE